MKEDLLHSIVGFDWDIHNIDKIFKKHNVATSECEEAFLGEVIVESDTNHSQLEERYNALGISESDKMFFIVFTIRNNKIRVISARPMNKKEKEVYYEKIKENT